MIYVIIAFFPMLKYDKQVDKLMISKNKLSYSNSVEKSEHLIFSPIFCRLNFFWIAFTVQCWSFVELHFLYNVEVLFELHLLYNIEVLLNLHTTVFRKYPKNIAWSILHLFQVYQVPTNVQNFILFSLFSSKHKKRRKIRKKNISFHFSFHFSFKTFSLLRARLHETWSELKPVWDFTLG